MLSSYSLIFLVSVRYSGFFTIRIITHNPTFQRISCDAETQEKDQDLGVKIARLPENTSKNRYGDVAPCEFFFVFQFLPILSMNVFDLVAFLFTFF